MLGSGRQAGSRHRKGVQRIQATILSLDCRFATLVSNKAVLVQAGGLRAVFAVCRGPDHRIALILGIRVEVCFNYQDSPTLHFEPHVHDASSATATVVI